MEAEWLSTLVDMGFSKEISEKAIRATNGVGLEAAIDYIQQLQDKSDDQDLLPNETNADAGRDNPQRILTEEEKKARDEKVEQLRRKVTLEREEKERKDQITSELQRRTHGLELSAIREKYNDQEIKRLAAERQREKKITISERERLRALIEQDKLSRKQQQNPSADNSHELDADKPVASTTEKAPKVSTSHDAHETRIQIRQPNGERLMQTFQASETLSAVRLFCQLNRRDGSNDPFILMQPHPRKEFSESDYQAPLSAIGLVPSATLQMTKPRDFF